MTSLHKLAQIREDLEEIRDHINTILTRDDLRVIDWELESMLKIVNIMLEGKMKKPSRKKLAAIRDRIEALREELDDIRQEVIAMREDLEEMLTGERR
jgi:regulator of replication initiation timing